MGVMPKPVAPLYRTTNWPEYNAALKRRGSLEIWFDPEMHWLSKRNCSRGWQKKSCAETRDLIHPTDVDRTWHWAE